MGYQLAALIVQGDLTAAPRDVFERLGFPDAIAAGTVPFIEATSPQQYTRCIGSNGSWTMLTDAMPFISLSRTAPVGALWANEVSGFLREASAEGRRAFGFVMSRMSTNYGFSFHADGKHRRSYLEQNGNLLVVEGQPLPEERDVANLPEQPAAQKEVAILRLMERLGIPFHAFEAVRFHYFAFERND